MIVYLRICQIVGAITIGLAIAAAIGYLTGRFTIRMAWYRRHD